MHQFHAFSQVVRGYKHMKMGSTCQDYAVASDAATGCSVIAVADGHGGADYFRSERGANFAAHAAATELMDFASDTTVMQIRGAAERDALLRALFDRIVTRWKEMIQADIFDDPFDETKMTMVSEKCRREYINGYEVERAYGTTLIAAVITEHYWIAVQQGDGRCIAIRPDGSCEQSIRKDERCQDNITTSMCDPNARNEFRYTFSEQLPAAVFACTDGVEASFADMDSMYGFFQEIATIYLEKDKSGISEIMERSLPTLSQRGNGDDVSIAGMLCRQRLEPIAEVLKLEEKLAKYVAKWEKAGIDAKDHEAVQCEMVRKLEKCRAEKSQLERQIDSHEQSISQIKEQINILQQTLKEKYNILEPLNQKLSQLETDEKQLEDEVNRMNDEQERLRVAVDEVASAVESLMDGTEIARRTAEEKKREQGESLFDADEGEDFTEAWSFINK